MRIMIVTFVLMLFSSGTFAVEDGCEVKVNKLKAEVIAEEFLAKQVWSDQYFTEAEHVTQVNCEWLVWFKNVNWKIIKPSRGKVSVNKKSGEPQWIPSK